MSALNDSSFIDLCRSIHHMMEYEHTIGLGEAFTEHSVKKSALAFLHNWKTAQTSVRCEYRTPRDFNKTKGKGRMTSIDIAIVHETQRNKRNKRMWPPIETAIELKNVSANTTSWHDDTWRLATLKSDSTPSDDFPEIKKSCTRYMIIFGKTDKIYDNLLSSCASKRENKRLWYLPWNDDWIVSGTKNQSVCSLNGNETSKIIDIESQGIPTTAKVTTTYFKSKRCSWLMGMEIKPV